MSRIALPLIRGNVDNRLESDGPADVDGIHAAQDARLQARNRLGQNFREGRSAATGTLSAMALPLLNTRTDSPDSRMSKQILASFRPSLTLACLIAMR